MLFRSRGWLCAPLFLVLCGAGKEVQAADSTGDTLQAASDFDGMLFSVGAANARFSHMEPNMLSKDPSTWLGFGMFFIAEDKRSMWGLDITYTLEIRNKEYIKPDYTVWVPFLNTIDVGGKNEEQAFGLGVIGFGYWRAFSGAAGKDWQWRASLGVAHLAAPVPDKNGKDEVRNAYGIGSTVGIGYNTYSLCYSPKYVEGQFYQSFALSLDFLASLRKSAECGAKQEQGP